mmetsp:Transcript_1921/g.2209  ORF Transcript_1921/g.2209 Transcript_1921/m.2209 type:complete len:228 (-) Transcript_1921:167-850(-)
MSADIIIKAAKKHLSTVQKTNFGTITMHNISKLNRYVTSSHDQHSFWSFIKIENLITCDRMLDTWNLWHKWPAPHCNQDCFSRNLFHISCSSSQFDSIFIFDCSSSFYQVDTSFSEHTTIDSVQSVNFLIFVLDQGFPVMGISFYIFPAKARRVYEVVSVVRSIYHELLWNTAYINTGTSNRCVSRWAMVQRRLNQRNFCPVATRNTSCSYATTSSTNDDEVVGMFC